MLAPHPLTAQAYMGQTTSRQNHLLLSVVVVDEMTDSERRTDIALAVLASVSIAGILLIGRAG
jgi:hypothetical protein